LQGDGLLWRLCRVAIMMSMALTLVVLPIPSEVPWTLRFMAVGVHLNQYHQSSKQTNATQRK
jgi:hypothetical protein